jgi:hypothetical protein
MQTTTVASTTLRACLSGEFQCRNGRCINKSRVCDYNNDCGDDSDEFRSICPGNVVRSLRFESRQAVSNIKKLINNS